MGYLFRPGAWVRTVEGKRPKGEPRVSSRFLVLGSDASAVRLQGEGTGTPFNVDRELAEEVYQTFHFPKSKLKETPAWIRKGALLLWNHGEQATWVTDRKKESTLIVDSVRRSWFATLDSLTRELFFWETSHVFETYKITPLLTPTRFEREALVLWKSS